MNKRFFISVLLAVTTVWAFQYFSNKKTTEKEEQGVITLGQKAAVAGQPIKIPVTQDLYRPLDLNIEFLETKISEPEIRTEVRTPNYQAIFSNYGAVLSALDFVAYKSKNGRMLRTVNSKGSVDEDARKNGCFLLALNGKTPFVYSLSGVTEKQDSRNPDIKFREVVYKAETASWTITKSYKLNHDSYKIDLVLGVEPKGVVVADQPERLRLFFTAPFIGDVSDDVISPFMMNESNGKIDVQSLEKIQSVAWFWTATNKIFGAQDKYFAHTLVNDSDKFVQRGYFKKVDANNIMPILEGPSLEGKSQWTMSFYFGPKVVDQLALVDERLTDLMSFGWLSWICKLLLQLLEFLYKYVQNYGFAIIILTILLRLPFVPLSVYSRKKMEEYQRFQPAINKIRTKFRAEPQVMQAEIMRFHREHNLSPATQMIGCLPMLIQIPILFGLYKVLNSYVVLYQAPFFGWIVDLSAKDPYYITPILMGLTMVWQQKMAPFGDEKQRVVMMFFSLVMTVFFAGFPAGLVLYWFVNNLMTLGEDYLRKLVFK
jgi:YidC/Oxa1 family membrane protein insertase